MFTRFYMDPRARTRASGGLGWNWGSCLWGWVGPSEPTTMLVQLDNGEEWSGLGLGLSEGAGWGPGACSQGCLRL